MKNIKKGVLNFSNENFQNKKELFQNLKNKQDPHTLFISCCDSRIIPTLITNTNPGDLFVVRNIANIVPPYTKCDKFLDTTSAIEYALNFLNIKNIVICGHSNCGGCEAIYKEYDLSQMPNVKKWLKLLKPIKDKVLNESIDKDQRSSLSEKLNLLNSFNNLLKYPKIEHLLSENKIEIHLWYYIIENGEIYEYNFDFKDFVLIKE